MFPVPRIIRCTVRLATKGSLMQSGARQRTKATITITNRETFQKLKINVVVNGYASKEFVASETNLDLSPKQTKTKTGYKFTARSNTITVGVPDGASVHYSVSDDNIVKAAWIRKWKGNTTKLKLTGHARGTATVTLTNSKTKQKVKINVKVGGYGIIPKLLDVAKKQRNSGGVREYYQLNRIKLGNATGSMATIDKKCSLRIWTIDKNEGDDVAVNAPALFWRTPVKIKSGNSKTVCFGDKVLLNKKGKYLDEDDEYWEDTYWKKIAFTIKVGKNYKTIYVDSFGMVTEVRNGRAFEKEDPVLNATVESVFLSKGASSIIGVNAPYDATVFFNESYNESDSDIVKAKWLDTSTLGDLDLAITGNNKGTMTMMIWCDKCKDTIRIPVTVN